MSFHRDCSKMFYYRYRPFNQYTVKEIFSDEIYFSSAEENNDPYEGFPFVVFKPDRSKWKKVLSFALNCKSFEIFSDALLTHLCDLGEISFNDFVFMDFHEVKEQISSDYKDVFDERIQVLKVCVIQYVFQKCYFASFSRRKDNYLMWSHYADKHKGLCLIFAPYVEKYSKNVKLVLEPDSRGRIRSSTFSNITYTDDVKILDGFDAFVPGVLNDSPIANEKEWYAYQENKGNFFLNKAKCWEHEAEVRLLHPDYEKPKYKSEDLPKNKRIIRYKSNQLVGIIFGLKMKDEDKLLVKEIISKKQRLHEFDPRPDNRPNIFMFFQSTMKKTKREIEIKPVYACVDGALVDDCETLYKLWNFGDSGANYSMKPE